MVEYPKANEIIICKVKKITNYGVFVELIEYDNVEGFIHISQVSSTWIKNIHNHVKQNQIRAARVLSINTQKNQIDLSFNRISSADEKRKISEFRLFKRAQSVLASVAKQMNLEYDDVWEKIAEPLLDKENDLYTGFVNLLKYGPEKYPTIDKKILPSVIEILEKNITIKDKIVSGVVKITCFKEDGVKTIRENATNILKKHEKANMIYVGPGKYSLKVSGIDYKTTSKEFNEITKDLEKNLKECEISVIEDEKK